MEKWIHTSSNKVIVSHAMIFQLSINSLIVDQSSKYDWKHFTELSFKPYPTTIILVA